MHIIENLLENKSRKDIINNVKNNITFPIYKKKKNTAWHPILKFAVYLLFSLEEALETAHAVGLYSHSSW